MDLSELSTTQRMSTLAAAFCSNSSVFLVSVFRTSLPHPKPSTARRTGARRRRIVGFPIIRYTHIRMAAAHGRSDPRDAVPGLSNGSTSVRLGRRGRLGERGGGRSERPRGAELRFGRRPTPER
jgi:hypothetical protein